MEKKKAVRITLISFVIYALLVATHQGEYWPFSIYPMFSQAGKPWTRALATDISKVEEDSLIWEISDLENLSGVVVEIEDHGVDQIDFSNFVSKTKNWDSKRVQALRTMLGEVYLAENNWMIYKVRGRLVGNDSVVVETTPYLLFKADTTLFNPNLSTLDYFSE